LSDIKVRVSNLDDIFAKIGEGENKNKVQTTSLDDLS